VASTKIQKFYGIAPKISDELLPDTVGQIADNLKTYSGDLIPYNKSSAQNVLAKTGTIKTIYPMDDGVGGYKWLHWTEDVDVATAQVINDTTQRIYYSGQSEPKITNYTLATTGGPLTYPNAYYTLGLPTPLTALTATAVSFIAVATATRARDSGNIATITTGVAHNLKTGMYVTITGLADATFNLSAVQVTVTSSTAFTYFSVGAFTGTATSTATRSRTTNVATIVTATAHGMVTGQLVTVTGMTDTTFNVAGVAVTVVDSVTFTYANTGANVASGADVGGTVTPTSPIADTKGIVNISGTTLPRTYVYTWLTTWGEESTPSPVSTIVYVKEGQTVNLSALPAAFPTTGAYAGGVYQTTGMVLNIYRTVASTAGTLYYKLGNVNLGTTTFVDNIDINILSTVLPSTYYDQPQSNMKGIKAVHNGMMVGFFGSTLCFAEPGQFHAWPNKYQIQLDANIIAVGNFGTSIVVATDKNPWLVQGSTPSNMSKYRMDYVLPCTSKRSMVNMGYGVVYASPGGLAMFSTQTGGVELTKYVHDWDTWKTLNYNTLFGTYYNDKYFAQHDTGAFIFEKDDKVGGYLVGTTQTFTAAYYKSVTAKLYFAGKDAAGANNIFLWDDPTQPLLQVDWKSKVIVTKDFINLGAARVIADYSTDASDIAIAVANAATLAANAVFVSAGTDGGSIGAGDPALFAIGDSLITSITAVTLGIQFQLFANKTLIFTAIRTVSSMFRLPTGYRTDTYEVRVTGTKRVRAIHLAETPIGLEQA